MVIPSHAGVLPRKWDWQGKSDRCLTWKKNCRAGRAGIPKDLYFRVQCTGAHSKGTRIEVEKVTGMGALGRRIFKLNRQPGVGYPFIAPAQIGEHTGCRPTLRGKDSNDKRISSVQYHWRYREDFVRSFPVGPSSG